MEDKEGFTLQVMDLTKEEATRLYNHLASCNIEVELVNIHIENSDKGYHYEYCVNIIIPEEK